MRKLPASFLILLAPALPAAALAAPAPRAQDAGAGGPQGAGGSERLSVTIDRIEVTGVTVFAQAELEEAIELGAGDRLERVKVVRTSENLQELYRARGYEHVGIRSRLARRKSGAGGASEYVLEFEVAEGLPTRVAGVRFTPTSLRDESFRKYWDSLSDALRLRAGLSPGDVFDQDKLSLGKRAVQDLLASEEFIGAKIEEVRVVDAAAPSGGELPAAAAGKHPPAARWVTLDFKLELGDRVAFGFRGNTVLTQAKLSALIEEQRAVGFGKDYVGAIRDRIREAYRSEGYAQAQVIPYTIERSGKQERHVTYDIIEGPRFSVEAVDFDGNLSFSNSELRKVFFERASTLLQHGYYVEKDVQKAAELVVEWMKARGYLSSKLVTINTLGTARPKRAGRKPASVRLMIYLFEGDQTLVNQVSFAGLSAISADEVRGFLGVREGRPLNLFALSEGLETLKAAYRARGYLGARILNEGTDRLVRYADENRRADVVLELAEGPQYRVGAIEIDGLAQTREKVVRRELMLQEGDVLSETALAESEARLRRLGIFSVVTVRLADHPEKPDAKNIRISVQEGTPGVIAGGPGFRNDLGIRLFGQAAYTNLWGLNHTLSFSANVNHRLEDFRFVEYQAQLAYLYPWFLGAELNFQPALTVTGKQYFQAESAKDNAFDATTVNLALTWEKRLIKSPNVIGSFTYSLERVHEFNTRFNEDDNRELRIGSIIPALRFDTRDNPLSPTTGWFSSLSYELAAPAFLSQTEPVPIGFSRIQGRVDRLIALPFGITWYLSYRGGFERSNEADSPIPLIRQFALGGATSLRGYKEQSLNVGDLSIRGTASYSNYRTQLDLPVSGALRVGPFLDAANLLVDNHSVGQFLFDSLLYGGGVGIHYQTPVGPVNLDWGYKLNPRPWDPDRARFYFSIGFL